MSLFQAILALVVTVPLPSVQLAPMLLKATVPALVVCKLPLIIVRL